MYCKITLVWLDSSLSVCDAKRKQYYGKQSFFQYYISDPFVCHSCICMEHISSLSLVSYIMGQRKYSAILHSSSVCANLHFCGATPIHCRCGDTVYAMSPYKVPQESTFQHSDSISLFCSVLPVWTNNKTYAPHIEAPQYIIGTTNELYSSENTITTRCPYFNLITDQWQFLQLMQHAWR